MSKISKFMFILGVLVLVLGIVLVYIKNKEKPVHFEYYMKSASYDKKTGKIFLNDENSHEELLGLLQFVKKPNSKDMASALVCAEHAANISKIDLYMPDMGHGAQPPIVKHGAIPSNLKHHTTDGMELNCMNVVNMQLFMPGLWQIRLFYNNGKVGLFNVELSE
jgi:hypothetical protein